MNNISVEFKTETIEPVQNQDTGTTQVNNPESEQSPPQVRLEKFIVDILFS